MSESIRNLFHVRKTQREDSGIIKVLVSLEAPPNDTNLADLQRLGLKVESVTRNKLIGEIESRSLPTLKEYPLVNEVERSVALKPTDDNDCGG